MVVSRSSEEIGELENAALDFNGFRRTIGTITKKAFLAEVWSEYFKVERKMSSERDLGSNSFGASFRLSAMILQLFQQYFVELISPWTSHDLKMRQATC